VYFADVWQTVQDERLIERFLEIITSRMPEDDLTDSRLAMDEIRSAIEPGLGEALLDTQEGVHAQMLVFPTTQYLLAVRYDGAVTEKLEKSCRNLLGLVEKHSKGKVTVATTEVGDATITSLVPAQKKVPYQPCYARLGDVFVMASSLDLMKQSLKMLEGDSGVSKFDDPRVVEALKNLPEPEDVVTVFDGRQLFTQLRAMMGVVKQKAINNAEAEKGLQAVNLLFDEVSAFDYEIQVGYTEGTENRFDTLGRLVPGSENTLIGKLALGGQPFDNWQSWIPADAVGYRLSRGVRLHEAYEHVMKLVKDNFPEAQQGLDQFEQVQNQFDLHLDSDIFQSFTGESVSMALPREDKGQDTILALKCAKPDRIRELLHRLIDALNQVPAIATQQLALQPCEGMEGFESLNVAMLVAFNVKPVFGFADGWMYMGSTAEGVQKVLDARAGKIATVDREQCIKRFNMPIEGSVNDLSFTDLKSNIHHGADVIRKVGAMAPMFIAMAGANANAEELKPVQEVVALLPSLAKVVEKFDFFEAQMTVVQDGPLPDSYLKRSVILVRAPGEAAK
jgi:hypothetical protein